jgi:Flp pilus assembly protein TadG
MKKNKHERGQSLVEMAVSLVLLLLLLSGTVEFGMAFFQFIQLRDAAQEGALYGSINPADTTNITARTQGASNSPINLTTITPDISYFDTTGTATTDNTKKCEGGGIKVTLVYNHKIFMPFMSAALGGRQTIPLTASVTDTILTPVCPGPP